MYSNNLKSDKNFGLGRIISLNGCLIGKMRLPKEDTIYFDHSAYIL